MKFNEIIKHEKASTRTRRFNIRTKANPELDPNSDASSDARLANALKGDKITDAEGLSRAYDSDSNYYANGDTLYIAGSKNPFSTTSNQGRQDWYDDFTKIPFIIFIFF